MTIDRETLMGALGLQSRRSSESQFAWAVGIALGGAVIGAGVALLMAPKAGTELRKDLMLQAKALIGPAKGHAEGADDSRQSAESSSDIAGV